MLMQRHPRTFPKARPSELCMLAGRWAGVMPDPAGAMVEQKIDGWRCLYFPGLDGNVGLWTRGGQTLHGAVHILERLMQIEAALGSPHMIDGEIQVGGTLEATKAHFETGWRLGDAGTLFAFDAVPLSDWQAGRCDVPLHERKAALARAIAATAPDVSTWEWREGSRGAGHGVDPVELVTDSWAFSAADVEGEAQRGWSSGHEGVMIKHADAPYVRRRCDAWLKLKQPGAD